MHTVANRNPLRILYVTETIPGRAGFGGELRCLHIARALAEVGRVEVAHLRKPGEDHSEAEQQAEFPLACAFDVHRRPNQGRAELLRWTFDPRSDYPFGLGVDPGVPEILRARLADYDLVWFFRLRAPEMFPNAAWARSVVDIDDLPTTFHAAAIEKAQRLGQQWKERRRMFSWRRRERLLGGRFASLCVCSEDDKRFLNELGVSAPVHVVPNGFELPSAEPEYGPVLPPRIGFIGLLDFLPNRDAIGWFIRECWPLILRQLPEARLRLAGQDTHGFLRTSDPSIDRLGWVADADEEMKTWSAMVVPVRIGAGTRIKIAHAFSRKCPVVSTSHGAYGYGAADGRELLLADTAETFAAACVRIVREPELAAEIVERAWEVFQQKWTWDAIRPSVWSAVDSCLRQPDPRNPES